MNISQIRKQLEQIVQSVKMIETFLDDYSSDEDNSENNTNTYIDAMVEDVEFKTPLTSTVGSVQPIKLSVLKPSSPTIPSNVNTCSVNNIRGITQYKLERKVGDNPDGTIQVEYVGTYPGLKEVGEVLGFKYGKTRNIYQGANKLSRTIIITKI